MSAKGGLCVHVTKTLEKQNPDMMRQKERTPPPTLPVKSVCPFKSGSLNGFEGKMCPGNEDLPPVQVCPSKHQLRVMLRPNLTASAKLDWLIWAVLVSETVQSDIKERAGGGSRLFQQCCITAGSDSSHPNVATARSTTTAERAENP